MRKLSALRIQLSAVSERLRRKGMKEFKMQVLVFSRVQKLRADR